MKKFLQYLRTQPVALISVILIVLLYIMMFGAEFFAPYRSTTSFEDDTFHPANIEITSQGLMVREYRVLDPVTWQYAKVKGLYHPLRFFVHGYEYRLFKLIPCDIHLFGTEPDPRTGEAYPVFLMGADNLGRDLFSRIVYGSRISLTIGFVASAVSLVLAILIGGIAGYYSGLTDWSLMRLAEFFMLIPSLYLILFLRSLMNMTMDSGSAYMLITLILVLVGWPGFARTIRGIVHAYKREEFVLDAALEGIPSTVIIFRHIIPQISSLLIVSVTLSIPGFIMSETTLSYIGLGISDPAVSWGSLISRDISTLNNLRNYPWLLIPVWFLLLITLSFNFVGDTLRDFFDPYHAVFRGYGENRAKQERRKAEGVSSGHAAPVVGMYNSLLSIRDLKVTFSVFRGSSRTEIHAVCGVSLDMNRGQVLGIVGESGSGKSVTTSAIPGLLPENASVSGSIFYCGMDLTSLTPREIHLFRGRKIGLVFQEPGRSFDPLQSIGSVFWETYRNIDPKITKNEAYDKAEKLLTEVGLPDSRSRLISYPHQFSGGQLQRIGIALALAQGCELLIADEPTTALDVTIQAQIVSLLLDLKKSRGLSIIFISHNIDLVSRISDRIVVMYGGLIMEQGTREQIMEHPRHPYTRALLEATPQFGSHYTDGPLRSIPGKVSDPASPEPGCPFAPRCAFMKDACCTPGFTCYKMQEAQNEHD